MHSLGKSADFVIYWKNLRSPRELPGLSVVEYMYVHSYVAFHRLIGFSH